MARSRRTTPFDDLITILARLPWWASVLIGLIAWLTLNPIANSPMPVPRAVTPNDMGGVVAGQLIRTFASFGQYLIPFACLFGAIGSVFARARRKKLLADVQSATQPGKAIDGLSWQQFEQLVGEAFRHRGYAITETGGHGPDGGVDLILRKAGEKYLVQCKHWRALKVGVPVIREFFGAMAVEGAAGGFVVTSGQFTKEAKAFASGRNIQLIDGARLKQWLTQHRTAHAQPRPTEPVQPADQPAKQDPTCPVCNSAMIKRLAKRGANAGNPFWGCSTYPGCRGVVNV
ncbi:restriction endonuclease [Halopseudomonas nanhaiensis]|uniref:restriction endonuclease n=1 Tax=Halopseudomonas nanhaiensis TaxID=2830842 RepID=UPI001CBFB2D8|nr:restriction endonuclease [Halopseudomonas nanhaiensis]UAW97202.1 restriction endonuclease [Halopseudomonas nanhaiensis]